MRWAFGHLQDDDGGSVYLRLSTRVLDQPAAAPWTRLDRADCSRAPTGRSSPSRGAELAVVYTGAVAPEALEAFEPIREDFPGAGLLAVPSPDRLHRGWSRAMEGGGAPTPSACSAPLPPRRATGHRDRRAAADALLAGRRAGPRGARPSASTDFGQSGDIADLYRAYRLDADAILDAAASLIAV